MVRTREAPSRTMRPSILIARTGQARRARTASFETPRCARLPQDEGQEAALSRSLAGLCGLDVELAHRAADHEVVEIELQRPRHAVLIELERHGIFRGLLA